MKLNNPFDSEEIFLKKSAVIMKIGMMKRVLVLERQFRDIEIMKAYMRQLHILGPWILMLKISIKNISIHGGIYTRQLMSLILEMVKLFTKAVIENCKKSIQIIHQNIPSVIKKKIKTISLEESLYAQRWL